MNDRRAARTRRTRRWLHEPVVHFFALGVLLFAVHQLVGEDESRRILVPAGLRADLSRRFQDERGRPPDAVELADLLRTWKQGEALYREALRRNLDRSDANIRDLLIEKMRGEAAFELTPPLPSEAELDSWRRSHPERYTLPRRYDFQFLTFPQAEANAEEKLAAALLALETGTKPSDLGRSLEAGKLTEKDLASRIPGPLGARIVQLTAGKWERVEGEHELWLVRLQGITGGLRPLEEVRAQVLADMNAAARERDVGRELEKTVKLYTFEEVGHAE